MARPGIISASRRTDIPAYYSEWFINRIRAGHVSWNNPYNNKPCSTSLRSEDVAAIMFWSKNFSPLVPHLDELDRLDYHAVYGFTITGLPKVFEPNVPDPEITIPVAKLLTKRYSPDALLWRYDTIVVSDVTPFDYHIRRFSELASQLEGCTKSCYFSFMNFYGKVVRNIGLLKERTGISCIDPTFEEKLDLSLRLAEIGREHGITLHSCCGDNLVGGPIKKAKCVDAELLMKLYPERMHAFKPQKTRKECGCYESRDIGAYDTCPHLCVYCYANSNRTAVEKRWKAHDPVGESMVRYI